jgi:AcrR family transcriptional regulator
MDVKCKDDSPSFVKTRVRLLDAAGEVFAERGFRSTTTREICRRAKANVAAINYHFRDKNTLYLEVLRHAHRYATEEYPLDRVLEAGSSPSDRLRAFVEWHLSRSLCEGRPAWQALLLSREMIEPTPAFNSLVQTQVRPILETMESICRDLLGPGTPGRKARFAARSVSGLCLYYRHAYSVIACLHPEERYGPADIHRLAGMITEFSLGGIERMARATESTACARALKNET